MSMLGEKEGTVITVTDVMRYVRNCFPYGRLEGDFTLSGGRLSPGELLLPGDWIAIQGSLHSDGVYCLDEEGRAPGAADEAFTGAVWLLKPPEDFLRLCGEIAAWEAEHREDLVSERFGVYSCRRAVDRFGLPVGWEAVFRGRLLPWRRMFWKEGVSC